MTERKYPPISIEIPDRETGEIRRVELSYSVLTYEQAMIWLRQLRYFQEIIRQWMELLKNISDLESEQSAYRFKREGRIAEALTRPSAQQEQPAKGETA